MNKNLIVKNQNETPKISELIELLIHYNNLTIKLESGGFKRDYIIRLQNELPNFCIYEMRDKSTLIIEASISTQKNN